MYSINTSFGSNNTDFYCPKCHSGYSIKLINDTPNRSKDGFYALYFCVRCDKELKLDISIKSGYVVNINIE